MHRFQLVYKIQLNNLNFESYWLVDLNFRAPDWQKFKLIGGQIYCRFGRNRNLCSTLVQTTLLQINISHSLIELPKIIYNSRLNFICFSRLRDATSHHVFKPFFSATRLFLDKSIMGLGSDKKEPDISIRRLVVLYESY